MISIDLAAVAAITGGQLTAGRGARVSAVCTDSTQARSGSLFVALRGRRHDGHEFLGQAAAGGAAAALVEQDAVHEAPAGLVLVRVPSTLAALQRLAAWYRREHLGTVVAITGSNGKTVTKDALVRLLGPGVAASPGSYNSQLGVALALLGARPGASLGVFEAGISAPGEMAALRRMLRPDAGVVTNIGLSHIAAFRDQDHLAREKLSLFDELSGDGWLLLPDDPRALEAAAPSAARKLVSSDPALPQATRQAGPHGTTIELSFPGGGRARALLGTRAPEIVDDVLLAVQAAWRLGVGAAAIEASLDGHSPPPTRMEVWRSPGGITLVNDAHSADPLSVRAALGATAELAGHGRKLFVFGGMGELGERAAAEHRAVGELAAERGFRHLLLLGGEHQAATREGFLARAPRGDVSEIGDGDDLAALASRIQQLTRPGDTVLLKAPRGAGIAEAAGPLLGAIAPSRLTVDLRAMAGNIARFRARCGGRVLAVVKALAYGSDLGSVASWVAGLGVDFLGVTTADEGVQIRTAGVTLPVLVTLVTPGEVDKIARHRLVASVPHEDLIAPLARAASEAEIDIHLKIDTGMGRLGVAPSQAVALADRIRQTPGLRLTGLMTHFSCADEPAQDAITLAQIARFDRVIAELRAAGHEGLLTHASASSGAARFPQARYDMVRIGLALHGVYPSPAVEEAMPLELAVSLVSTVAMVREARRGDALGYGASYTVTRDRARIGVIPLGYADGIPWSLGNRGEVLVEGRRAPIVGRVSMDSLLIDLSDIEAARAGSEVLVFGSLHGATLRPEEVAARAGTIPYELLTRIGPRIQRIYRGF
jgi:alanine racemase